MIWTVFEIVDFFFALPDLRYYPIDAPEMALRHVESPAVNVMQHRDVCSSFEPDAVDFHETRITHRGFVTPSWVVVFGRPCARRLRRAHPMPGVGKP